MSENKTYKIFNYETGYYEEVSKESYERYESAKAYFKPTIQNKDGKIIGKVIITSSNPEEGDNQFYNIFQPI